MSYQLDTGHENLPMFFKDWELRVLEYLWSIQPSGVSSREVWRHLQQTMDEPISRTSVINFLKDMAEKGVLAEEKKSGKGGYHGIYYQKYTESEFKQYMAEHFIMKLFKEFPEETRKAVKTA